MSKALLCKLDAHVVKQQHEHPILMPCHQKLMLSLEWS